MESMLRAKAGDSLSIEEMRQWAPVVFADRPHESRSDRYVYISTENVLTRMIERDFVPVEVAVKTSRDENRRAFTKHLLRFRHRSDLTDVKSERRVGDTSFEVLLRNAHDGSGSYKFMAGLLRLICLNGMVVSDGTVADVTVIHRGSAEQQLEQVVNGAYEVLKQGPKVMDKVRRWKGLELKPEEQMLLAESVHQVRFDDGKTSVAPKQLLIPRRSADAGSDLWSTFNRIQENVIRGGLSGTVADASGRVRRATTREVRGIDGDIRYNRAMWSLAEHMAELKAA
jgi:hypothetical protein